MRKVFEGAGERETANLQDDVVPTNHVPSPFVFLFPLSLSLICSHVVVQVQSLSFFFISWFGCSCTDDQPSNETEYKKPNQKKIKQNKEASTHFAIVRDQHVVVSANSDHYRKHQTTDAQNSWSSTRPSPPQPLPLSSWRMRSFLDHGKGAPREMTPGDSVLHRLTD